MFSEKDCQCPHHQLTAFCKHWAAAIAYNKKMSMPPESVISAVGWTRKLLAFTRIPRSHVQLHPTTNTFVTVLAAGVVADSADAKARKHAISSVVRRPSVKRSARSPSPQRSERPPPVPAPRSDAPQLGHGASGGALFSQSPNVPHHKVNIGKGRAPSPATVSNRKTAMRPEAPPAPRESSPAPSRPDNMSDTAWSVKARVRSPSTTFVPGIILH